MRRSIRRQSPQQRRFRDRSRKRTGNKRLLAGRGASYLALSPMANGSTARTSIRIPARSAASQNQRSRSSTPPRADVVERKPLHNVAGCFMWRFGRRTPGVAAQLRPKNLIPLAHVEHGWVFGNSLSLFGEDVGRNRSGPARRTRPLLRPALGRRDHAGQVEDLSDHGGIGQRHRHRHCPVAEDDPRASGSPSPMIFRHRRTM